MQLRLTYEGELLSGGRETQSRRDHKHHIRRRFHPQIRRFWSIHPHLSYQLNHDINGCPVGPSATSIVDHIADRFQRRDGFRFIPLVREKSLLMCSLEVLYLRPQSPGSILHQSDIDNRLKTIFDALKVPSDNNELPNEGPTADEKPFYCLPEDDKLITRVTVETDYLLDPISSSFSHNDARLILTVCIHPYITTLGNIDGNAGYS